MRVFLLFCTLCVASAATAACLRFLCVCGMLGCDVLLTAVCIVTRSVLGEMRLAEPARARRAQHFFWADTPGVAAEHSQAADGRLAALATIKSLPSLSADALTERYGRKTRPGRPPCVRHDRSY